MSPAFRLADWTALPPSLDPQADLYPAEQAALDAWIAAPTPFVQPAENPSAVALARLLEPIQRSLAFGNSTAPNQATAQACCRVLLRAVYQYRSAPWTWNLESWVDLVGPTAREFAMAHALGRGKLPPSATPSMVRQLVMHCAYLLGQVPIYTAVPQAQPCLAARCMFGPAVLLAAVERVQSELRRGGWAPDRRGPSLAAGLSLALLHNRSPRLEDLTLNHLEQVYRNDARDPAHQRACVMLSQALHTLAILPHPLAVEWDRSPIRLGRADTLPAAWQELIGRWTEVACCGDATRNQVRYSAAQAGRWSAQQADAPDPEQWTRATARKFVAALATARTGQWAHPLGVRRHGPAGQRPSPGTQAQLLNCLRRFFADCQECGWIPTAFTPSRYLATPKTIRDLCGIKPRVIDEEVWRKLLAASLSLTPADLRGATATKRSGQLQQWGARYPFEMVRAAAITWILAGLRSSELCRLAVGCVRELPPAKGYASWLYTSAVPGACYLHVPANKAGCAFDKAVAQEVGDALRAWEQVRPVSPPLLDRKTREPTHFLFKWRGGTLGCSYINDRLIPLLCRKAGVPTHDAGGPITSHRARATIVTQMYLSGQMGLLDLQRWLHHRSLRTTLYYVDVPDEALLLAFVQANHHIIQQSQQPDDSANAPKDASTAPSGPGATRAQVETTIRALEQLCADPALPAATWRVLADQLAALRYLVLRLPPDSTP